MKREIRKKFLTGRFKWAAETQPYGSWTGAVYIEFEPEFYEGKTLNDDTEYQEEMKRIRDQIKLDFPLLQEKDLEQFHKWSAMGPKHVCKEGFKFTIQRKDIETAQTKHPDYDRASVFG